MKTREPMRREYLRSWRFTPYREGCGPVFKLRMWDTYSRCKTGQSNLAYSLQMSGKVLFTGADYGCSPMHAIDSDASAGGLLAFLTLRPGDTDAEYFDRYSTAQLAYCAEHAELLSMEVETLEGRGEG